MARDGRCIKGSSGRHNGKRKVAGDGDGCEQVPGTSRKLIAFFDFDKNRASMNFKEGEILAIRDEYGMPRCYARVEKNGDIRFLSHSHRRKSNGSLHACGNFFISSHLEHLNPFLFSHKVERWETDGSSNYNIYPKMGEIWAITKLHDVPWYRQFFEGSPTTEKYALVEVVEDYNSDRGVKVVFLVRIEGVYQNLFHRNIADGSEVSGYIAPIRVSQLFSHQLPYFRVSGEIKVAGCLEMDISSLPLYIDNCIADFEPEMNDNYLCLGFLDYKVHQERFLNAGKTLAVYDDQHGVPTKYIIINSNQDQFTIEFLFTEDPKTRLVMHEMVPGPSNEKQKIWCEAGLPIACGNYVEKPTKTEECFIFSHEVYPCPINCDEEVGHKFYSIRPERGDVWAIYGNIVRNCHPRGLMEYRIVEILKQQKQGIQVAYLVRVKGFKCLFKRKGASATELIPEADEFRRFSHQIPSYRFTETWRKKFPEGSIVLDPFLVPEIGEECFSFCDSFLFERPKVHLQFLAFQHFIDKERNRFRLNSKEKPCGKSNSCSTNLIEEDEDIRVLAATERRTSLCNKLMQCGVPFHSGRSKAHSIWLASGDSTGGKNRVNFYNQKKTCDQLQNCVKNIMEELESISGQNGGERKQSQEEISHVTVHGSQGIEVEPIEDETNCRQFNLNFHDFDDSESENNFELDQIWALYSEVDGLPHSYARINKFIPLEGQVEVTLLEPHPMAESELQWAEENLPVACGMFRLSKSSCVKEVTVFSYRVTCDEGNSSKSFYRIFPRKGDVWAIYKNWDPSWSYSDLRNNLEYILVEVLSSFTEETGVTVAALVREENHEPIFRRQLNGCFEQIKTFTRKELLRFSHRIPSHKMNDDKEGNTCNGRISLKFSHKGI